MPAELMRFPERSTSIGSIIDTYLKSKADLDDRAIHLLFSANRWELDAAIRAKLLAGTTVICDRYAFSGCAYSSAKPGMDLEWCKAADAGLVKPDAILYLTMPESDAEQRAGFGEEV